MLSFTICYRVASVHNTLELVQDTRYNSPTVCKKHFFRGASCLDTRDTYTIWPEHLGPLDQTCNHINIYTQCLTLADLQYNNGVAGYDDGVTTCDPGPLTFDRIEITYVCQAIKCHLFEITKDKDVILHGSSLVCFPSEPLVPWNTEGPDTVCWQGHWQVLITVGHSDHPVWQGLNPPPFNVTPFLVCSAITGHYLARGMLDDWILIEPISDASPSIKRITLGQWLMQIYPLPSHFVNPSTNGPVFLNHYYILTETRWLKLLGIDTYAMKSNHKHHWGGKAFDHKELDYEYQNCIISFLMYRLPRVPFHKSLRTNDAVTKLTCGH